MLLLHHDTMRCGREGPAGDDTASFFSFSGEPDGYEYHRPMWWISGWIRCACLISWRQSAHHVGEIHRRRITRASMEACSYRWTNCGGDGEG